MYDYEGLPEKGMGYAFAFATLLHQVFCLQLSVATAARAATQPHSSYPIYAVEIDWQMPFKCFALHKWKANYICFVLVGFFIH